MNWDKIHQQKPEYAPFNAVLLDQILAKFPHAVSALDIGCGSGELSKKLSQKGLAAIGIDLSHEAITQAKVNVPDAAFVQSDFMDYKNEIADLVFMKLVLAFLPDKLAALQKANLCTSHHGAFVLSTPVTFEGYDYDGHYQAISVDYEETTAQLRAVFGEVTEFNRSYTREADCRVTWLCKPKLPAKSK